MSSSLSDEEELSSTEEFPYRPVEDTRPPEVTAQWDILRSVLRAHGPSEKRFKLNSLRAFCREHGGNKGGSAFAAYYLDQLGGSDGLLTQFRRTQHEDVKKVMAAFIGLGYLEELFRPVPDLVGPADDEQWKEVNDEEDADEEETAKDFDVLVKQLQDPERRNVPHIPPKQKLDTCLPKEDLLKSFVEAQKRTGQIRFFPAFRIREIVSCFKDKWKHVCWNFVLYYSDRLSIAKEDQTFLTARAMFATIHPLCRVDIAMRMVRSLKTEGKFKDDRAYVQWLIAAQSDANLVGTPRPNFVHVRQALFSEDRAHPGAAAPEPKRVKKEEDPAQEERVKKEETRTCNHCKNILLDTILCPKCQMPLEYVCRGCFNPNVGWCVRCRRSIKRYITLE